MTTKTKYRIWHRGIQVPAFIRRPRDLRSVRLQVRTIEEARIGIRWYIPALGALLLLLVGCGAGSVEPVTWAVNCTTYCAGGDGSAEGTLCWDSGGDAGDAAQESVAACESMIACAGGAMRCSCTATEVGDTSCQNPGEMLSLAEVIDWVDDPCSGTCIAGEVCIDDVGGAYCAPQCLPAQSQCTSMLECCGAMICNSGLCA